MTQLQSKLPFGFYYNILSLCCEYPAGALACRDEFEKKKFMFQRPPFVITQTRASVAFVVFAFLLNETKFNYLINLESSEEITFLINQLWSE